MDKTEILVAIARGDLDSDLPQLSEALRERRKVVRSQQEAVVAAALQPGDRVRFNGVVNPRYLQGVQATVVSKKQKRVVVNVDQDHRARRFSGSPNVTIYANTVEKIEA